MLHPKAFLDAVKSFLPRFTMLRCLHINCVDVWKMGDVQCRMDDDFATVTSWGAACPSLLECILPRKLFFDGHLLFLISFYYSYVDSNNLKWLRVLDDLWFPDPSDPQGFAWLLGMVYSRRYPQWSRVVGVIEEARKGKTGFEGIIEGLRSLVASAEERSDWDLIE